jgi:hypothetical protein
MDPDLLLSVFGGVVVGGLLTGLFSLAAPALQSKRDHQRWLRESRLIAYGDFLAAIDVFTEDATTRQLEVAFRDEEAQKGLERRIDELDEEVSRAQSRVVLLGPDAVRQVASEYHFATIEHIQHVQNAKTLEEAASVSIATLQAARGLMLGVMNRTIGIGPTN